MEWSEASSAKPERMLYCLLHVVDGRRPGGAKAHFMVGFWTGCDWVEQFYDATTAPGSGSSFGQRLVDGKLIHVKSWAVIDAS